MSETDRRQLVERIHDSGKQLVLSLTGGGSGAIGSLLAVPGASATVLEAIVPYAPAALEEWLGGPVDHFCSERTARAMAMAAFERARQLSGDEPYRLRGIGATASLATNRPKRGPHRVHVAWQSTETTATLSCELAKGQRTRAEEEAVAADMLLTVVAEACGVADGRQLEPDIAERFERRQQRAERCWTQLLVGERNSVFVGERSSRAEAATPAILFPGAFNPLHTGHEQMARSAAARYGAPVTFELSITNVDKPPLDFIELSERLAQLAGNKVLLTRAPTFAEKAALVPGCVFIVGIDTLTRIGDERYYGGDTAKRDAAIAKISDCGCRFVVFGRSLEDRFIKLSDARIPSELRRLCDEVSESDFRADVSSTELRSR